MNRNLLPYFLFLLITSGSVACQQKHTREQNKTERELKEELIQANIRRAGREEAVIDRFVELSGFDMTETGTGLRYYIYENGNGPKATLNDLVTVDYQVRLLDSTVVYSTDKTGAETFRVGRDNVESGLHEAAQLLAEGDKAILILPSHRAFGFTGDRGKIPHNATLLYDLQVLKVEAQ